MRCPFTLARRRSSCATKLRSSPHGDRRRRSQSAGQCEGPLRVVFAGLSAEGTWQGIRRFPDGGGIGCEVLLMENGAHQAIGDHARGSSGDRGDPERPTLRPDGGNPSEVTLIRLMLYRIQDPFE